MARDGVGQPGELANELPASLSGVASGIDGVLQGFGLDRELVVRTDAAVRLDLGDPGRASLSGLGGGAGSLGGAAFGPADGFGGQASGRVERGTARRGADEFPETSVGLGELRPALLALVGAAGEDGQVGVDRGDPLRRWAARAAAPMCRAWSTSADPQRTVAPAGVGRHRRSCGRIVDADAVQDGGDRRSRQRGGGIGAQQRAQRTRCAHATGADQQLAIGRADRAVGRDHRGEQPSRQQRALEAGPRTVRHIPEVDTAP